MRIFLSLIVGFVVLAALGAAIGGVWFMREIRAPGPLPQTRIVLIERGWGAQKIAQALKENEIVANALVFRLAARARGGRETLKAGEYEFPAHVSVTQVLEKIAAGDVYPRRITIPEGLTSQQILALLAAAPALSGDVAQIPAEGSLLPETYAYVYGDTRQSLVDQMQAAMRKTLQDLWPHRSVNLPVSTPEQAVTLASIVEKETGVAAERPRIAGVFVNRLQRGMPLQSDPTVLYAMTGGTPENSGQGPIGRRLLSKDLSIDSPYNTYKYPGLPPGPIAAPGRDALAAALNPERNDFLYFVADGTGGHEFSRTLEEHNRNVARWRTLRRTQAAE